MGFSLLSDRCRGSSASEVAVSAMWDMAGERVDVAGVSGSMLNRICACGGFFVSVLFCLWRSIHRRGEGEGGGERGWKFLPLTLRIVSVAEISFE